MRSSLFHILKYDGYDDDSFGKGQKLGMLLVAELDDCVFCCICV